MLVPPRKPNLLLLLRPCGSTPTKRTLKKQRKKSHIGNPHWTEEEIFLAIEAISAIYLGGYTERNGRFKTYEGTFHDLGLKGGRLEDAFMDQMRLYGVEPAEAKNYRTAKAIMKKVKDAEKVLLGVADPQDEKTSKTAAAAARRWPIRLQFLINQKKRMSRIVSTTSKNQKVSIISHLILF